MSIGRCGRGPPASRSCSSHRPAPGTGSDLHRGPAHNSYYGTRNMIVVCERQRPLPPPLSWLRRGVILATFAAYALRQPNRRGARRRAGGATATRGRAGSDPAPTVSGLRRVGLNLLFLVPGETGGSEIYVRHLVPEARRGPAGPSSSPSSTARGAGRARDLGDRIEICESTCGPEPGPPRARRADRAAPRRAPPADRPPPQPPAPPPRASRRRQRGDDPRRHLRALPGGPHLPMRLGMRVMVPLAARGADRMITISHAAADEIARS